MFFMTLAIGIHAQSGTYTANGLTWKYTLNGSDATITGVVETTSTDLNIPSAIVIGSNSYPVKTIGKDAFKLHTGLKGQLTLPNGLVTIGEAAFYQCEGLTGTLNIPSSVKTIGSTAFAICRGFTGSLVIPNSVTTIKDNAFIGCRGFNGNLKISNGITKIEARTFQGCDGFTGSLTIPNGVTEIGDYAFVGLKDITELNISGSVNFIGKASFAGFRGLTGKLIIPYGVISIGYRGFGDCDRITELILPNSLTTIRYNAFEHCEGLNGILTIPSSVTSIENGAFRSCINLKGVTFAPSSNAILGAGVFDDNRSLDYIDVTNIPAINKVIKRQDSYISPFYGLQNYTMIYLPSGSNAPEPGEVNFVLDGKCENFVVYDNYYVYKLPFDGCDYPIIHPFTAVKASYANRTFSGKNCKTLCLPFPSTLPDGMIAYELKEKNVYGRQSFMFTSISGNQLEANKPYLLRITDGGTHAFGTEQNVQVPVTPSTIEVPATHDGSSFFCGTTVNIKNAVAAAGGYYNLFYNQWLPIKTDTPNGHVNPFRAYIRTTGGAPAKGFTIVLDDENKTTGIESTEEDIEQMDDKIYSLDGKCLGNDINVLKSGEIYIKNGKKFYKF